MLASEQLTDQLDLVKTYAVEVGSDVRLVQGAGGNFSVKSDDVIWIKASGTRLSRARAEEIFVPMRLTETRAAVLKTEDLSAFIVADDAPQGLRPSIETSLHALLPHRVVLHVHCTGAIAAALRDDVAAALQTLPDWFTVAVIPYAKPGIGLARAVFAEIGLEPTAAPIALLLRNHGLIAAAQDAPTAARIVDAVQRAFATRIAPAAAAEGPAAEGWSLLHPPGTLTESEAALVRLGPFTPDEAVFLGAVPFTDHAAPESHSLAALGADGSVWVREDAGADEAEIASSIVDVARLLGEAGARPLTHEQVDELINWEAEKWRRSLKR